MTYEETLTHQFKEIVKLKEKLLIAEKALEEMKKFGCGCADIPPGVIAEEALQKIRGEYLSSDKIVSITCLNCGETLKHENANCKCK